MSKFFFIQSQDLFTDVRARQQFALASRLAARGNPVTVLLVQNAVLAARLDARVGEIFQLREQNVTVLADHFSLQQREISAPQIQGFVTSCDLDVVIDALANGDKVIWN